MNEIIINLALSILLVSSAQPHKTSTGWGDIIKIQNTELIGIQLHSTSAGVCQMLIWENPIQLVREKADLIIDLPYEKCKETIEKKNRQRNKDKEESIIRSLRVLSEKLGIKENKNGR